MMKRRRLIPILVLICAAVGFYAFRHTSERDSCVRIVEQSVMEDLNEDCSGTCVPELRLHGFARLSGESRVVTPSFQTAGPGRHLKASSGIVPHIVLAGRRTDFSKPRSGLRSKNRYLHSICQLLI
ncbi:MAG: hypothetical protein ACI399_01095 [Candidatus Cryptobacteroides sp.]